MPARVLVRSRPAPGQPPAGEAGIGAGGRGSAMSWTLELRCFPNGTRVRWFRQPVVFPSRAEAVQWLRDYAARHPDECMDNWRIRRGIS